MKPKVDVRSLLAAATPGPEIVVHGGIKWPLYEPSPGRCLEVIRDFPRSAEALAAMAMSATMEPGLDQDEAEKRAKEIYVQAVAVEGPAVTGAYMNMVLGGERDPEVERGLTRLPDPILIPLFADMLRRCPKEYRGFFGGMAMAAAIPTPVEEDQAEAPAES